MRLPHTATLFLAVAALILLLTVLSAAPGVDISEDTVPSVEVLPTDESNESFGLMEVAGFLSLTAIVLFTLLLLRRMSRS